MPAVENFALGLPVEVGAIDRELKKLWQASGGTVSRASLINLAVYSETPGSLGENTAIISQVTENHACRAIVIEADRDATDNGVKAWISAHCHVNRAGRKQICSEQLSFRLQGEQCGLLRNIVFAQLDSDLPLYLWWQENFRPPMDPQLWAWVDRAIYDSHGWGNFDEQIRLVETVQEEARQRIVLSDLNWVRLVHLRLAIAQFFDHPLTHHHLKAFRRVEIEHAPGFRSTALLLIGWLAGQLGWHGGGDGPLNFRPSAEDRSHKIEIVLREKGTEPITACRIATDLAEFRIERKPGADLLDVFFGRAGGRKMQQVLPAGKNDIAELLREELMRGGPHRVYLRAISKVRELM